MKKHAYSLKKFFASLLFTAVVSVVAVNALMIQYSAPCKSILSTHSNGDVFSTQPSIQSNASVACNRNNQNITWLTWLANQSGNTEFHYLDLLELLNREK
ncbi:hypothetical protein [Glaciecola sp. 1036]|uniref:hypothetical protein n=1 Tax=Alteromonadaceae TaxID=72275 RepID=UPI003D018027